MLIAKTKAHPSLTGTVMRVGDGVAHARGMEQAANGEIAKFETGDLGIVMSLDLSTVAVALLSQKSVAALQGKTLYSTGVLPGVLASDHLFDHVVDPLGHSIAQRTAPGVPGSALCATGLGELSEKTLHTTTQISDPELFWKEVTDFIPTKNVPPDQYVSLELEWIKKFIQPLSGILLPPSPPQSTTGTQTAADPSSLAESYASEDDPKNNRDESLNPPEVSESLFQLGFGAGGLGITAPLRLKSHPLAYWEKLRTKSTKSTKVPKSILSMELALMVACWATIETETVSALAALNAEEDSTVPNPDTGSSPKSPRKSAPGLRDYDYTVLEKELRDKISAHYEQPHSDSDSLSAQFTHCEHLLHTYAQLSNTTTGTEPLQEHQPAEAEVEAGVEAEVEVEVVKIVGNTLAEIFFKNCMVMDQPPKQPVYRWITSTEQVNEPNRRATVGADNSESYNTVIDESDPPEQNEPSLEDVAINSVDATKVARSLVVLAALADNPAAIRTFVSKLQEFEANSVLTYAPLDAPACPLVGRRQVSEPFLTGITTVDALFPIGLGQRQLVLGDRRVGKTSLLTDAVINQKGAGIISIYVAIGQRASKVGALIQSLHDREIRDAIYVVAGAGEPAALQFLAPYAGVAIAEYFARKRSRNVTVFYDDLSKHSIAHRQLSLILRRPPGREAFPADLFYVHSRLLERAGCFNSAYGNASITAIPVIETEGGDVSAYVPTNLISITDGQLFLDSAQFKQGYRPAIDIGISVSRVGRAAQSSLLKPLTSSLKITLTTSTELEQFSAFSTELDANTIELLQRGQTSREVLKQRASAPWSAGAQAVLLAITSSPDFVHLLATSGGTKFPELMSQVVDLLKNTLGIPPLRKMLGEAKTLSELARCLASPAYSDLFSEEFAAQVLSAGWTYQVDPQEFTRVLITSAKTTISHHAREEDGYSESEHS